MSKASRNEMKRLVLDAAHAIADDLYDERGSLPRVSFWAELEAIETNSDGWAVEIATIGNSSPRLEVWIDKYTNAGGDRFYAGLAAGTAARLQPYIDAGHALRRWSPVATITSDDLQRSGRFTRLATPLSDASYGSAVVERLNTRENFFGVYDAIEPRDPLSQLRFSRLAEDFFLSVLATGHTSEVCLDAVTADDYPAVERKRVRWHIQFERNSRLAAERKRVDRYKCGVCGEVMHKIYGDLGYEFAEAHHKMPLKQLEATTTTTLDDLLTVCPNCHRMLHRMEGKPQDIEKLRRIVARVRNTSFGRSGR